MQNVLKIPFNKPYSTGGELGYIKQALKMGKISGNGVFTQKCHSFFNNRYGFGACLLTTSCTDALEMAAILLEIKQGDEVIMPAFTFVSTANAFVLRGAKIKFVDSKINHPSMDESKIEKLITEKTKAIVLVHYAGVACDMDKIMELATKYNLFIVEDAAQAIDNYFIGKDGQKRALGSIGHLSAFSFHETKNIISGEGGMLVINDKQFIKRAEIIWEKGTNRSAYFKGEVNRYEWVDIGSSFLPSEITAAYLYAQLEQIDKIQNKRKLLWQLYYDLLVSIQKKDNIELPIIPKYSENNAHLFYIVCKSKEERGRLIKHLNNSGIGTAFHYQSLASSFFYSQIEKNEFLENAEKYSDCLLRLPLFYELKQQQVKKVSDEIVEFYT